MKRAFLQLLFLLFSSLAVVAEELPASENVLRRSKPQLVLSELIRDDLKAELYCHPGRASGIDDSVRVWRIYQYCEGTWDLCASISDGVRTGNNYTFSYEACRLNGAVLELRQEKGEKLGVFLPMLAEGREIVLPPYPLDISLCASRDEEEWVLKSGEARLAVTPAIQEVSPGVNAIMLKCIGGDGKVCRFNDVSQEILFAGPPRLIVSDVNGDGVPDMLLGGVKIGGARRFFGSLAHGGCFEEDVSAPAAGMADVEPEQVSVLPVSETCKIVFRGYGEVYRGKVYVHVQDAWLPVGEVVGSGDAPQRAEWKDNLLMLTPQSYFESYYLPHDEKLQWVCATKDALLPQQAPERIRDIEVSLWANEYMMGVEYVRAGDGNILCRSVLCRSVWLRCAGMWMLMASDELPCRKAEWADELQWQPSDYFDPHTTPWWSAVLEEDDASILDILLKVTLVDADGKRAARNSGRDVPKVLTDAALKGAEKCLDYLLKDADLLSPRHADLYRAFVAVGKDDAAALQQYLAEVDVNGVLRYYDFFDGSVSLLYFAVLNHRTECVEALLQHPELDMSQYANAETLMLAASRGEAELLRRLLTLPEANVNVCGSFALEGARSLLHVAAACGDVECVRVLLAHPNINLFAKAKGGETPLQSAEKCGHEDCAALIREAMKKAEE